MSQSKAKKKTVISTTKDADNVKSQAAKGTDKYGASTNDFLFGRKNFVIMIVGVLLIGLGMLLMSGGGMPSPDVWDESIIYSTRRTLIAPIVILLGLGLQIYAIFAKK